MEKFHHVGIPLLWIAWFIYWRMAGGNVKPTARHESLVAQSIYIALFLVGVLMFTFSAGPDNPISYPVWEQSANTFWLGFFLVLLGFAFTVWARVTLGRNWSATVTQKEDHELIQTGPYALVRHPIYTGLMIMFLGNTASIGQVRGLVALALVLVSFIIKLRMEERAMTGLFGDRYAAYRKRVATLIPWIW